MNGSRGLRLVLVALFGALLVGAAWIAGAATALLSGPEPIARAPEDVEAPAQFEVFRDVWRYVDAEYFGHRPAPEEITAGAVEGLVQGIEDDWALFYDADTPAEERVTGPVALADLGLWVEPVGDGVAVLAVLPDGPAAEAGIAAGDRIVGARPDPGEGVEPTATPPPPADEEQLPGQDEEAPSVLQSLRDDAGQPDLIVIGVRPDDSAYSERLVRSAGHGPGAARATVLEDGVVHAVLPDLAGSGAETLLAELAQEPPEALVLDLRDNPGGPLEALPTLAGHFFQGDVYRSLPRDDEEGQAIEAEGDAALGSARLAVLVNAGTGGSAEILAAALREQAGAELVGAPTFGRGRLQEDVSLQDGSLLRLTARAWRSPEGLDVEGEGLAPDRLVEERAEQLGAAVEAARGLAARAGAAGADG